MSIILSIFFLLQILVLNFLGSTRGTLPSPADYVKEYCAIECHDQKVLCQRKGYCGPDTEAKCYMIPSTDEFRQWILHYHNALRNKIALGLDTRGGNSKASRMNALSYDKEIEFVTWCYSNKCIFAHDECHEDPKHEYMGQNIATRSKSPSNVVDIALSQHWMDLWYNEILLMNTSTMDKLPTDEIHEVGHFTQLMWDTVQYIGCTRNYQNITDVSTGKVRYNLFLFCQYDTGNFFGSPVYKRGEPCSACPAGKTCNRKYMGLCGEAKMDTSPNKYYLYLEDQPEPVLVIQNDPEPVKTPEAIAQYDPFKEAAESEEKSKADPGPDCDCFALFALVSLCIFFVFV